jgi:hypothetical protein
MSRHALVAAAGMTWVLALVPTLASADTWALPKEQTYCSPNEKFCVLVVPRQLSGQLEHFEAKGKGKEPAGHPVSPATACQATLYARASFGRKKEVWKIKLSNDVAPVDVLVSDDGQYVVTLDNWGRAGYGDDVLVVYGPDGNLVKKYSLEELLGDQAQNVGHSVSSRWWRKEARLETATHKLYLLVELVPTVQVGRIRVTRKDSAPESRQLTIELKTGRLTLSPAH